MKKRLFALMTALLMLLSLSACGEKSDDAPEPEVVDAAPTDELEISVVDEETLEPEPEPTPQPEPTPIPVLGPIDPEDLPEGLADFLIWFDYGYSDRMGGKEFDCENCVDVRANILAQIVTSSSCVDLSIYPGEQPVFHWKDGSSDPQGLYESGNYAEFDPAQIEWIAENIFHLSEKDYRAVLSRCTVSNTFYSDRNREGEERFFADVPVVSPPNTLVRFESASFDGSCYEVVYHYLMQPNRYLSSYLAFVSYEEIDGNYYWTLRSHTVNLPEYETEEAPELFAELSDPFYLRDEDQKIFAELIIREDGSFTGHFQEYDTDIVDEYIDAVMYYSDFEGLFVNPQKIDPYTYSIELVELIFLDEEEDFIMTDEDGWRILNEYSYEVGLENSRVFYVYAPGAPYYKLPEIFTAWYANSVDVGDEQMELPTWGLINPANGKGFGSVVLG